MGRLVEQPFSTLFGGVSRQPAPVRKTDQVSAGDNALFSVVTGGWEKRPPTQTLAALSFLDPANTYAVHPIDRDATEQTFILANANEILAVNSIDGSQITVTVGDSTRYYLVEQANIDSIAVVQIAGANMSIQTQFDSSETTFDWEFALSDASTVFDLEGSEDGITWVSLATGKTGATGTFSTTIDAAATGDHNYIRANITTGAGTAADTITLKATFKDLTYLLGASQEDLQFATVVDTTFIVNRQITARMAEADSGTVTGEVQEFTDLVASAGTGNIYRVTGTDTSGFGTYYVIDDTTSSTYKEHVDPNAHNNFDASSLPHTLTRNADGTFTYKAATWIARQTGDEEITPEPKFIGKQIQDISFYRNRLTFLADEESYTSQAGSVFDLWPEKAVEVVDTDPVSRAATTKSVNILRFAEVFRKLLFITSQQAQFELTSTGKFTPETALLDRATTYTASPIAKPKAMGDVLYFPSKTEDHAVVYEYFFDQDTLSNTATDVTKHVVDYVPNDILQIDTDPTTGTVYVLTTGEQNSVYIYRTFFDGTNKLQSSWGRYVFGATESDALIHGLAVMSGFLVMVIERDDGLIYLEQMPVEREAQNATVGFSAFLDQREVLTGTYDSTNDVTHWDTTWEHMDDAEIVLGPALSEPGVEPTVLYPDRYLLSLTSVAAAETLVINTVTFIAHATTTTAANREFSISGTDAQDTAELVSLINDATFGVSGVTATDNLDGTLTLDVDDKADGTITAPTGTAITNATIVAVELGDVVAARGDLTAGSVWVGRPYTMSVELSTIFHRDSNGVANLTGRLQLKDISFRLADTGYLNVNVAAKGRTSYDFPFEGKVIGSSTTMIGGASIEEGPVFKVPVWSNSENVTITLTNDRPVPCVVTAAAWRGFFNEISRQE